MNYGNTNIYPVQISGNGEVYMRVDSGYIQYSNDNITWYNVIAVADLEGEDGATIVSVEFIGDDIVFTKSDSTTVTITNGKLDITGADGEDGINGTNGLDGASAYVYIAYASDDTGTDFTLIFDSNLDYIAVKSSTVEIPTPIVTDFAGLWKNYKGAKGEDGLNGTDGEDGENGVGVPEGGTTGQVLKKQSNDDFDTIWDNEAGGDDEKVKYDSEDSAAGYIADKITAGSGISVAEGTGANENKLVITNEDKGSDVDLSNKQDKLVSGVNIKSINGNTLLGSGDIAISGEIDPSYELIKYYFI